MNYSFLPLLLPVLVISCATPAPISKLTSSQSEITFWSNGREVLTQSKDSISIEVSFYEKQNNLFIFDITVANEKDKSVIIDPIQFSYLPISTKGDTLNAITATSPESKILEHQMRLSKLEAERKNELTELLIFGSLEIVSELSKPEDYEGHDHYPSSFDIYEREIANINYRELTSIDGKVYWENQTIRKTTLFSDHYLSGQVLFQYKKDVKKIGLRLSIEGIDFEFWFEHLLIPYRTL